ncbi:Histidine kinase [Dyadobacter koreensis]|uniref:Histidine kinase n=2 Tax=Dyadobacter koreensis TaxID=408657 RepID=A0A1H6QGW9_9BACT|nr:Histidine kinase [Dyadobacter koreensis]
MLKWIQKIRLFPRRLELWLYSGLFMWIAIIEAQSHDGSWQTYFFCIITLAVSQSPVLGFVWNQERLQKSLTPRSYLRYRIFCFGIYLPLLALLSSLMLHQNKRVWEIILLGAVCTFCLEMILTANAYFDRRLLTAKWVKHMSLEKAVFISLTLIALTLSAMAVSSLGNPLYDSKGQFLIGFEFSLVKIFSLFDTFLSYAAQLLLMYLCGYVFFLINSRILVAKVLKEKGMVLYILSSLATVGIFYPSMGKLLSDLPFSKQLGGVFSKNPFVWENAFGAIIILLISLPVLLATQWSKQNSRIVSLEKEKNQAQLNLLKQQLNPHFFFNTLNNLYALSLQKSKETPQVILQLADLMRYVIYKAQDHSVPIADEVRYLEDYIQLESIRIKDKFDLRFDYDTENTKLNIAPLLLIVIIENAFKHGIEPCGAEAFLHITLKTRQNKLYFTCRNSFQPGIENQSGIGLNNLQKRLDLLYPGRHKLLIEKKNITFNVHLELENYECEMPDH